MIEEIIEQLAKENGRSMNAEIVYRLQKSVSNGFADAVNAIPRVMIDNVEYVPRAEIQILNDETQISDAQAEAGK